MTEAIITKQIKRCEALYESKKTLQRAFLLAQRYFVSFTVTGDKALLHKACFVVATELNKNPWCFDLYFFGIYLKLAQGAIPSEDTNSFDEASRSALDMLDKIKGYKNGLKKNNPEHYLLFMYFSAILSDGAKRLRVWNELGTFEQEHRYSDNDVLRNIYFLKAAAFCDEGYSFFAKYLERPVRSRNAGVSALFFITLAGALEEIVSPESVTSDAAIKKLVDTRLDLCLPAFLKWSVAHGYDVSAIIAKLETLISAKLAKDIELAKVLYKAHPNNAVLQTICTSLMLKRDYSEEAFYYYREAELKQMLLPKLYEFVVLSASKNGIEDISRFSLDSFLSMGRLEAEHKPFVYHTLLTNKKHVDLIKRHAKEITQYGIFCLENRMKGRYYNSIYKFLLDTEQDNMKGLIDTVTIERLLYSQLFLYEVTVDDPKVRHIFVYEKEKNEKQFYQLSDGIAVVKATSDKFSYILFGEGKKTMYENKPDNKIKIRRLIENADIKLYLRYFERGIIDADLLIVLTKYYMSFEKPPLGCLDVLTKTVSNNSVSKQFRMHISAALGNYYSYSRDYAKSVSYFKTVDENLLNDKHIEQMLLVYVNAREYEKAVNLISKKADCISDRNLFFSLKQISTQKSYEKSIANIAYELILKSWYDKTLIDIVLRHYYGSQEEWQEFSNALSTMNVTEQSLDEIILKNAIWMHKLDTGAQMTFSRMYEVNPDNPYVVDFSMYCAYEIIINNVKPEYGTLDIMERVFLSHKIPMIAYALVHVYINHDVTTFRSDSITESAAKLCESEGILFPVFKQIKDKELLTPYIEKNQPFMYRSQNANFPDKTVLLHYKPDNFTAKEPPETGYKTTNMKYIGFGLYLAHVTHFYGEVITYYISEEMNSGSISSKEQTVENTQFHKLDGVNDQFYAINNALIFEQMFKYNRVEEIITNKLQDFPRIKGWIM